VRRLDAPLPPQAARCYTIIFHPLPSLPTLTKYFTFYSVSAFSFYLKKKTPAKEKQTQGFAPRPRERRAAVHSLLFSVGSSAHSPVNSLRSNSTGNVAEAPPVADEARRCWRKTRSITPAPRAIGDYVLRGLCGGLQSKPFPRSSQLGCTTAARLLEACSSRFIKSLALPFLLFFFHNFRFAVPYTQKSYPRNFPRVGSLFYYAYKPAGGILKVGRSLGDLLHGDLFFSELTLILILIVVFGLAVEGAVGGKGYYRAAAL